MNFKQIHIAIILSLFFSFYQLLFGIVNIDNDDYQDFVINLPYWFIFKACIGINALSLIYMYSSSIFSQDEICDKITVHFIVCLLLVDVGLNALATDILIESLILWKDEFSTINKNIYIYISLWISVVVGYIIFCVSILLIYEIHRLKANYSRNYYSTINNM